MCLTSSLFVRAQVPQGAETCEQAVPITVLPFVKSDGSLEGQPGGGGANNPATTCPGFDRLLDSPEVPILWYSLQGFDDDNCLCLELRSFDNAFIVGLYRGDSNDSCDSLDCLEDTDFTSEVLVWRSSLTTDVRIAVSLLDSGPLTGNFQLTIIRVNNSEFPANGESLQASRVPGSCESLPLPDGDETTTAPSESTVETPVPTNLTASPSLQVPTSPTRSPVHVNPSPSPHKHPVDYYKGRPAGKGKTIMMHHHMKMHGSKSKSMSMSSKNSSSSSSSISSSSSKMKSHSNERAKKMRPYKGRMPPNKAYPQRRGKGKR